jgi:hypothetical protein
MYPESRNTQLGAESDICAIRSRTESYVYQTTPHSVLNVRYLTNFSSDIRYLISGENVSGE